MESFCGTPNSLASSFFISDNTGWVAGQRGTILKTTTGGIIYIREPSPEDNPDKFILTGNYPNPFGGTTNTGNPVTTIEFTLPEHTQVNLSIYNILGAKVTELVNTELSAGTHHYDFNCSICRKHFL